MYRKPLSIVPHAFDATKLARLPLAGCGSAFLIQAVFRWAVRCLYVSVAIRIPASHVAHKTKAGC